jgi:hypothetical protein
MRVIGHFVMIRLSRCLVSSMASLLSIRCHSRSTVTSAGSIVLFVNLPLWGPGFAGPLPHYPRGFFTLREDQACYAADLTTT